MTQAPAQPVEPADAGSRDGQVPAVPVEQLAERLALPTLSAPHSLTSWEDWSMDRDDGPLLSALAAAFQPRRHLEFGTWQGAGARRVLEACDAVVWSLNLPQGEAAPNGDWQYAQAYDHPDQAPPGAGPAQDFRAGGGKVYFQSDAHAFIGRQVHQAGLGHRFCQILCNSRDWQTDAYPQGFFDSALIDGGHDPDTVESDTRKALPLIREGGILLWHDYCPPIPQQRRSPAQAGVALAIERLYATLQPQLVDLFWIQPSQLLLGVKGPA